MSLKLSMMINFVFLMLLACSWGAPKVRVVRDEKDKLYRPCEDSETIGSSVGKLCSRTCPIKEKSHCKEWKTTVKVFSEEKDFLFFRNGSFVFIPEQYL